MQQHCERFHSEIDSRRFVPFATSARKWSAIFSNCCLDRAASNDSGGEPMADPAEAVRPLPACSKCICAKERRRSPAYAASTAAASHAPPDTLRECLAAQCPGAKLWSVRFRTWQSPSVHPRAPIRETTSEPPEIRSAIDLRRHLVCETEACSLRTEPSRARASEDSTTPFLLRYIMAQRVTIPAPSDETEACSLRTEPSRARASEGSTTPFLPPTSPRNCVVRYIVIH
eukprot:COSAG03_NODE_194_length_10851_cov_22.306920_4_plen_229_part_00